MKTTLCMAMLVSSCFAGVARADLLGTYRLAGGTSPGDNGPINVAFGATTPFPSPPSLLVNLVEADTGRTILFTSGGAFDALSAQLTNGSDDRFAYQIGRSALSQQESAFTFLLGAGPIDFSGFVIDGVGFRVIQVVQGFNVTFAEVDLIVEGHAVPTPGAGLIALTAAGALGSRRGRR